MFRHDSTARKNVRPLTALPWLLLLFLGLLTVACQPAPEAGAEPPAAAETATPTSLPPVVVAEASTPTSLPSFSLPTAVSTVTPPPPTETASPETLTATVAASATVTSTATPGPSPTPAPTFTRPAPVEETNDHFWFRRPVAAGGIVWTDKHYPYGSTRGGQLRPHHGVEFNVGYNTEILAVAPGTVRVAGDDSSVAYGPHTNFYGNLVVVEHDFQIGGQPVFSLYAHLNQVLVAEGQQVATHDVVGLSGATGVADGPHVHLEVRVGANGYDRTRNPLLWLYPFPDRGVIAGRVVWPNGQPVTEAPVTLNRIDGSSPYQATTTYAGTTVNPDGFWQENFALDDVYAGYYEVTVRHNGKRYTVETWVYPYRTSFVEIVLE